MSIINYFQDKLSKNNEQQKDCKNSMLKAVEDGEFNSLSVMSDRSVKLKEAKRELVKDAVNYLSVKEFIALSSYKASVYTENTLLNGVSDTSFVAHSYRYDIKKPSTIQERALLVSRFGHQLNEAKV